MIERLFRGKSIQAGEWIYGGYYFWNGETFIIPYDKFTGDEYFSEALEDYCVEPETVGQLRYENKQGRYFDGDVYYHAGNGDEVVSAFCELHVAIVTGNADDIGKIKGNVHDNPELLCHE